MSFIPSDDGVIEAHQAMLIVSVDGESVFLDGSDASRTDWVVETLRDVADWYEAQAPLPPYPPQQPPPSKKGGTVADLTKSEVTLLVRNEDIDSFEGTLIGTRRHEKEFVVETLRALAEQLAG